MMDYQAYALEMAKTLKRLEASMAVVALAHPDCAVVAAMAQRRDQHHAAMASALDVCGPSLGLNRAELLSAGGK
jgi:poly-beta-hydroxyalkanoate depolymerase